jgi:hypothetical protein
MQQLRSEVAHVEAEDRALAHRHIAPRRGVEVAIVVQPDAANREQPAADVGVFAVKFDDISKPPMRSSAERRTAKLPP